MNKPGIYTPVLCNQVSVQYFPCNRNRDNLYAILTFFIVLQFLFSNQLHADTYAVTAYGAVMSGAPLDEIITMSADYDRDYYFSALAIARKIGEYKNDIDIELEGQFVRHSGRQHYHEYNALIIGRWWFPSIKQADYSVAIGEGLSYADEISEIEALHHSKTSRLLDYLLFEFTFSIPETESWHGSVRIHHRSGIYGLFHDVHGASNALGLGVRYQF